MAEGNKNKGFFFSFLFEATLSLLFGALPTSPEAVRDGLPTFSRIPDVVEPQELRLAGSSSSTPLGL